MPLNPDAVGSQSEPTPVSWTSKDTLLYAVSLGAGTGELQYTTENTKDVAQQVLPTYPVVIPGGTGAMANVGTFNPAMLVHGSQSVTLHRPLPVAGNASVVGKLAAMYDKGKAAVVVLEGHATDDDGQALYTTSSSLFIRG
ncbi:MAG: htdY, partial [Acidimicrobiales bacterium]|nr:htdY [Acidimicrobiales bacterium]